MNGNNACPNCKAALPDAGDFPLWCPACDWNLDPAATGEAPPSTFFRLLNKVRERHARRQFESLIARDPTLLKPSWSVGKVITYGLAGLVNLFPFLILAFGVWIIAWHWPEIWAIVWGGAVLLVAWVIRPRFPMIPKNLLPRSDAPRLHELVDRVAHANQTPTPYALTIEPDFNAAFLGAGLFRRRSVVMIGLPLWTILTPQERIALLSHEFAHGIHRDSLTSGIVGNAIGTLLGFSEMTRPSGEHVFVAMFSPVLAVISGAFRSLAFLMITLLWHHSQEAEFLADFSASRVAGSEAAASLLRKLMLGSYPPRILEPISYSADWRRQNFFPTFREFVQVLPALEAERVRRLFMAGDFARNTTHPPPAARVEFMERHSSAPSFVADPDEMAAIDVELARFELPLTESLLARYYPEH